MEVKNIGHQDSVTMGTYDIEEIEKSNENKVEIIWKQSQQIEKLKDKLQKQAEWIENNKNKAKNCAMQMQNQGKEIQRLKQSNKDLMAVIWKTKRERANKGREVCKVNNEVVQYKKRIAELEEQLKNCIKPKFKIGQDVIVFDWSGQLRNGRVYEIQTNSVLHDKQQLITYLVDFYGAYEDDDQENNYYEEKEVFITREEAQAKLKKLKV